MAKKTARDAKAITDDQRWAAVTARDLKADGTFFYSVGTTGFYCRPSCPSRTPQRVNVAFYETAADAETAGFRPCRRCRPDKPSQAAQHATLVAHLYRFLESAEEFPDLEKLASQVGLSSSYVHRFFKAATGLTPKAYAVAHRARRFQAELDQCRSITEILDGASCKVSSRLFQQADHILGMTSTAYRLGGVDSEIRFTSGHCSLGAILVAATEKGICAVFMGDDPARMAEDLQDRFPEARSLTGDDTLERYLDQVVALVEAPQSLCNLPLDLRGTAFQLRVWRALQEIPPGRRTSYSGIAERIGDPKAARAVARACGANPLAVVIPCHRVVRRDGGLSGYRWGVGRKKALLEKEMTANQADAPQPFCEETVPFQNICTLHNGREIYYLRIAGDEKKPCLVFLHEALGSTAMWKDFPAKLCLRTGCQGLVYDRTGNGKSSPLITTRTVHFLHEYALQELPEIIEKILPGRPVILVGHSDGGSISLIFGAERPACLKAIITEAAHVFVEPETLQGIEAAVTAYEKGHLQGLSKYHGIKTDTLFRAWADTWLSPWFKYWNIEYLLPSLACPLLVLQGKEDQYGTARQVEMLVARTSGNTESAFIENCRHSPHLEQPDRVLQIMADFIKQVITQAVGG